MIPIKIIESFAYRGEDDRDRFNIQYPYEFEENIVATDGHILVIVPINCIDDDEVAAFEQKIAEELVPSVANVIEPLSKIMPSQSINYTKLIKLFKKVCWKTVDTEMRVETQECPNCGHDIGDESYEVKIKKHITVSPFELEGLGINARYLLMLVKLFKIYPDGWKYRLEYNIANLAGKNVKTHRYCFINNNGIKIIIMGIRL